jgi:hypothetical protein
MRNIYLDGFRQVLVLWVSSSRLSLNSLLVGVDVSDLLPHCDSPRTCRGLVYVLLVYSKVAMHNIALFLAAFRLKYWVFFSIVRKMKLRKRQLRESARIVLERRGLRVELKPGAGIVPGARLRTFLGSDERQVAVRTSLDREVGFTRHPDGRWITITKVDEIVVAVPSEDDPNSAEVLSFNREALTQACDAALAAQLKETPGFSPKAPLFIALDPPKRQAPNKRQLSSTRRSSNVFWNLKEKAIWNTLIPLADVPTGKTPTLPAKSFIEQLKPGESFIEQVKREFARLNRVHVSQVAVEFKIIS